MVALNIDSSTDERKENIILTENDIPGAKIPRESLEYGGSVQPNNPCLPCGRDLYPSPHSFCNWRIILKQLVTSVSVIICEYLPCRSMTHGSVNIH
jgi:hypothetical protein